MVDKNQKKLKLNLGCGLEAPPFWINVDASPNVLLAKIPCNKFIKLVLRKFKLISEEGLRAEWPKNVLYCDLTKSFPEINPNSCSVIYSSCFLEHIPLIEKRKDSLFVECVKP